MPKGVDEPPHKTESFIFISPFDAAGAGVSSRGCWVDCAPLFSPRLAQQLASNNRTVYCFPVRFASEIIDVEKLRQYADNISRSLSLSVGWQLQFSDVDIRTSKCRKWRFSVDMNYDLISGSISSAAAN